MPFINFSNFDPLDSQLEREVDYLYNAEGGVGYFLPTKYFDLMATIGYRMQVQRMTDHLGFASGGGNIQGEEEVSDPDPPPNPGPKRFTEHSDLVQQGIICGLRINW